MIARSFSVVRFAVVAVAFASGACATFGSGAFAGGEQPAQVAVAAADHPTASAKYCFAFEDQNGNAKSLCSYRLDVCHAASASKRQSQPSDTVSPCQQTRASL